MDLNGTDLLCQHVSTLFSLMLSHCIAPSSFCMSTMIPIPKGSGSMGDIKNYRGIAYYQSYLIRALYLVNLIDYNQMICNLLTNLKLQQFSVFLPLQKLLVIM